MTDEEKKAKQKQYRDNWKAKPGNLERLKQNSRRWRSECRDKYLEGHKRSRNRPDYKERENARQTQARRNNPFLASLNQTKYRAKKEGWDNDLDVEYLRSIWTGLCPITGKEIQIGQAKDTIPDTNRASLDRLDSTKGYIKGNVQYVSFRANNIKTDATFEEFEQIYLWWKDQLNEAK